MKYSETGKRGTSNTFALLIRKTVLIMLIGACLVLGVIGLILPVLPGILFLFIGAMLLSKLSTRFAGLLKQSTWAQKWKRRAGSFRQLNNGHKLKLSFLMAAKSLVDSAESVWQKLQRTTVK
ncbi:MAG: uncharacterized membrane protein YbaN (DUF454 family) [Pseudohongiellaceae bacterium]|jgi:uncharacterized membrane protein YbaN (DUF454 family)